MDRKVNKTENNSMEELAIVGNDVESRGYVIKKDPEIPAVLSANSENFRTSIVEFVVNREQFSLVEETWNTHEQKPESANSDSFSKRYYEKARFGPHKKENLEEKLKKYRSLAGLEKTAFSNGKLYCLKISNLSKQTTKLMVQEIFKKASIPVRDMRIIFDTTNDILVCKGFGFVRLENTEDLLVARNKLDGSIIDGMVVSLSIIEDLS